MPPRGKATGGGELRIVVKGLDSIRGGSGRGGGGGDGSGHVGRPGTIGRKEEDGGQGTSAGAGVPTDGTRGQGLLANVRVLICCSTSTRSRDQISNWITELGGTLLSPMDYKSCTHIYIEGEIADNGEVYAWLRENKTIINWKWIKEAYDTRRIPHDLYHIDDGPSSLRTGRVQRTLCFDEEQDDIVMCNHQLFVCKADKSEWMNLTSYVEKMKKTLVNTVITPGSLPMHKNHITDPEVKSVINEIYVLLKSLHKAGYSLSGEFTTDNFALDKGKRKFNLRFYGIHKIAIEKLDPDKEDLDIKGFVKLVRRQIFKSKMVPHDVNVWLSLVGKREHEDVITHHIYLLDYTEWTEPFMTWYDLWGNLQGSDMERYMNIMKDLADYRGWKKVLRENYKNTVFEETLVFIDPNTKKTTDYSDDAYGLIHMMRNCRQHNGRKYLRCFALIASQYFPNLISDLQLALIRARVIGKDPQQDRLYLL